MAVVVVGFVEYFSLLSLSNALCEALKEAHRGRVLYHSLFLLNGEGQRWCRMLPRNFQYFGWGMFDFSEPCLPNFLGRKLGE